MMTRERLLVRLFATDALRRVYSQVVNGAQIRVFDLMRNLSTTIALLSLVVGGIFELSMDRSSMGWQVALALFALAVGIPHGALDHLVSIPRDSLAKTALFIVIYILIAIAAVIAIISWNVAGFYLVVVMSALHFGIGDTAFLAEQDRLKGNSLAPRASQISYALASGCTPVLIPLVNERSTSALATVNPALIEWHKGADSWLLQSTLALLVVAIIIQIFTRRVRDAIDLSLLGLVAFFLPPLVAFAIYFGTWHALRHTARLTINLASSQRSFEMGDAFGALRAAVIPGIPALLATILVAVGIVSFNGSELSDDFLWTLLVVIWALTVPHMMVTARLDRRALSKK